MEYLTVVHSNEVSPRPSFLKKLNLEINNNKSTVNTLVTGLSQV